MTCPFATRLPRAGRGRATRRARSRSSSRAIPPPAGAAADSARRAGRRRHRPPRARVSAPLRSTSSSLDLRLPALGLRAGDVRGPDTQTQTQTVDGRPPSDDIARDIVPRDIAVRDVRDVSDDDESEDENDAVAIEAFGDARALVGGGAGLSPRTLKRNERDLLRALSHSHDGDAARRDVRSTHDASVGGTQEVNTQDAALDPYLRLARAARRAADGPAARNPDGRDDPGASRERDDPGASRERDSQTSLSKTSLSKRDAHEKKTTVVTSLPLAGLRVYLRSDVRGKRREIFAEKLSALGAEMATDAELKTVLEIKGGTSQRFEMSKQDPDPTGSYRFVAVTSDTSSGFALETQRSLASSPCAPSGRWRHQAAHARGPARFPRAPPPGGRRRAPRRVNTRTPGRRAGVPSPSAGARRSRRRGG